MKIDWKGLILFLTHKVARKSHKRISLHLYFEVDPEFWNDCPHFESYVDALRQAKIEDQMEGYRK